jgi:hypothetical protein
VRHTAFLRHAGNEGHARRRPSRNAGFGAFDHGEPDGDAGALAKAFKHAAISAYGMAGPEFVRRLIAKEVTGEDVRADGCGIHGLDRSGAL